MAAYQLSPKRQRQHSKLVYQKSPSHPKRSSAAYKAIPSTVAAAIPVFMLPHDDDLLATAIPEEAEIREGFMVNMALPPHRHRVFTGLVSISDPDLPRAIERTATTAVEFRSFVSTTTTTTTMQLLAQA